MSLGTWLAAAAPILLLLLLVVSGKVKSHYAALAVAMATAVFAVTVFGTGLDTGLVAIGKGLWLGTWILYVIMPAMLLYRVAERAGFKRIGALFEQLFPERSETVLVLAWLLPAFIQGVAGFGTPIAVVAPLLVSAGWSKVRAVALPLIGNFWAVTFGSMGSSYYMAQLTAHLDPDESVLFANHASLILGVCCLLGGLLVMVLDGGFRSVRRGLRLWLGAGIPTAVTLHLVTAVLPGIGSVSAAGVGVACALGMAMFSRWRRRRTTRSSAETVIEPIDLKGTLALLSPYLWLLGIALTVMLIPPLRNLASMVAIAPSFPATTTQLGQHTAASVDYTPLHLLTDPGGFVLLACLLGYLTYRRAGLWTKRPKREMLQAWWRSVRSSSLSVLALAVVTTLFIHSGMVMTLAEGVVLVTGAAYPFLAPLVGAMGSFLTGSTTTSNALFSVLQSEVAGLLDVPRSTLLAGQTAGSNVGNSLAPVAILIGTASVGGNLPIRQVMRIVAPGAAVLLVVVSLMTVALIH